MRALRTRLIRPDYFTDDEICSCSPEARLLLLGLWCLADRYGRVPDMPEEIAVALVVLGADADGIRLLLAELTTAKLIRHEWNVAGQSIWRMARWEYWQGKPREWRRGISRESVAYTRMLLHDPCSYCGAVGVAIAIDHIEAYSKGGAHDWTNLTAACKPCNSRKRAKTLLQFVATRPWERGGG